MYMYQMAENYFCTPPSIHWIFEIDFYTRTICYFKCLFKYTSLNKPLYAQFESVLIYLSFSKRWWFYDVSKGV